MTVYFKGHPVVLASGSPRRKELLEQIGIKARIRPSVQEEKSQAETPEELVMELAAVKAQDIAAGCESGTLVIGADTVVVLDSWKASDPGEGCRNDTEASGPGTSGLYRCYGNPVYGEWRTARNILCGAHKCRTLAHDRG